MYRDVLLRVSNYALEGLRVDALPRIHSLFNLHIALHSYEDLMPKTMRDATLLEEVIFQFNLQLRLIEYYHFRGCRILFALVLVQITEVGISCGI